MRQRSEAKRGGWRASMRRAAECLLAGVLVLLSLAAVAEPPAYSFGVLAQRSVLRTAEYWNPILAYAGRRAGVALSLRVARSGGESGAAAAHGDYDFIFSNHIFQPRAAAAGYRVILRTREAAITGQIVVLADSPVTSLAELAGREVGFPSPSAFVGYAVPQDHLLRQKIDVRPVFGATQEGIMAQLKAGRVVAAGVNGVVMKAYAEREGLRYRVLWESPPYFNLPVAVHPRVPAPVAAAVAEALAGMDADPEGRHLLGVAAAVVGQKPPYGFVHAAPADYANYTAFYRNALLGAVR